jgi:hypothetical protein
VILASPGSDGDATADRLQPDVPQTTEACHAATTSSVVASVASDERECWSTLTPYSNGIPATASVTTITWYARLTASNTRFGIATLSDNDADALVRQAEVAGQDLRRLLHATLGDDASPTTMNAIFNAIRGTALSHQITDTLSGHNPTPHITTIDPTELAVLLAGLAATARLDSGTNG